MQMVFEDRFSADMAENASDYVDEVFNGISNGLTNVHLISKAFDLGIALFG